ncbi:MAG: arginine--tRNA ligase [Candidatus Saccharibacteria bacterium]|nr:arginine--tRNA ligase [Candidatus Saccharibacteria bacterium]
MDNLKEQIKGVINDLYGVDDVTVDFASVPSEIEGDYSTNVAMRLARRAGKAPRQIAEEIIEKLGDCGLGLSIAGPGFINVTVSGKALQKQLADVWSEHYGDNDSGQGRLAISEFPSTNIAKPYSVGHLRPGTQGWAAKKVLEANGWKVKTDNHLGDVGTPFGIWAVGFKRSGIPEDKVTIYDLGEIYIKMKADLKEEEKSGKHELADEVQEWLKRLEAKDEEAVKLSKHFGEISLKHTHEIMERLGISTDLEMGESNFVELGKKMVEKYVDEGIFERNKDGSVICRLDDYGIDVPMLMLKSNGTALYATTDLGCLTYRDENIHPDKIVYAVGAEQKFYFEQLFAMAKKVGIKFDNYHLVFGTIDQISPEGKREKMSSRKGVVLMESLLDDAEKRVRENFGADVADEDISKIAVGAIKFSDFVADRTTGILYDPDKIFALAGQSGPFCQYACVRMRRILEKNADFKRVDFADYDFEAEKNVLQLLLAFPGVVAEACEDFRMHKIAGFAFELAQELNRYYEKTPITSASDAERSARLWLISCADFVLARALDLLGIEIPEKM